MRSLSAEDPSLSRLIFCLLLSINRYMRILYEDILDDLDVRSANSVEKSLGAASEINPDLYDCAFVIEISDNS